jgi:hypothetical protein
MRVEIETWLRGSDDASTEVVELPISEPAAWTDTDVRVLLEELLRALERAKHPDAERNRPITLRGFSWIVSPFDNAGVILQLELQLGAAAAGPFAIPQVKLDELVTRVLKQAREGQTSEPRVH